jgi:hypothetical protein
MELPATLPLISSTFWHAGSSGGSGACFLDFTPLAFAALAFLPARYFLFFLRNKERENRLFCPHAEKAA